MPVGLAFSANGCYLYITNEEANPTDPSYSATACNIPNGIGGTDPGPEGILTVVDVQKAKSDPPHSVLASVYAGCSPVRVVLCLSCVLVTHDMAQAARLAKRALVFETGRIVRDGPVEEVRGA